MQKNSKDITKKDTNYFYNGKKLPKTSPEEIKLLWMKEKNLLKSNWKSTTSNKNLNKKNNFW